jgi:hypothetical protein
MCITLSLLGNLTAAMNTDATKEELLKDLFSVRPMSYRKKIGDKFFPELLV